MTLVQMNRLVRLNTTIYSDLINQGKNKYMFRHLGHHQVGSWVLKENTLVQCPVGYVNGYEGGGGGARSRGGVCAGWVWRTLVGTGVWVVGQS
jgi:hypothetical protein